MISHPATTDEPVGVLTEGELGDELPPHAVEAIEAEATTARVRRATMRQHKPSNRTRGRHAPTSDRPRKSKDETDGIGASRRCGTARQLARPRIQQSASKRTTCTSRSVNWNAKHRAPSPGYGTMTSWDASAENGVNVAVRPNWSVAVTV